MREDFVARRLAHQMWGEVQRMRKLGEGIWLVDTAGHGGIVVDIDIRTELKEFRTTVYNTRYGKDAALYDEQHFAAFEEDCNAQMVEWTYPSISAKVAKVFWGLTDDSAAIEWLKNRKETLRSSLKQWHPAWVAEHPYGWGENNKERTN